MSPLDEAHALPPVDTWPDRSAAGRLGYPETLNLSVELVDRHLPALANKTALVAPDGTLTYGELAARVNRIAHVLEHTGVGPGDRVLLRMANSAALAAAWLAVQRAGAIAIATFSMLRARELDQLIADAEPAAVIVDPDLASEVARTSAADVSAVIDDLDERAARAPSTFAPSVRPRDAIATIIYTADPGGAAPRGACHSSADLLATADAYARHVLQTTRGDVFGGTPPLAFAYGLGALLLFPLRFGATATLTTGFDAAALAESIGRDRVSLLFGTPTSYKLLMRVPDFEHRTTFDALRIAVASGEPLDAAVAEEWHARTNVPLVDGFGTTEMAHIFLSQTPAAPEAGTLGRPVPGYDVRVMDADGRDVAPGETGRLIARGPTGCRYWRRPDAQRRTVREGWTMTGDLVTCGEDGALRFAGRADNLIVSAGYNVSGAEVARVLREHAAVADARVTGAPDPVRGTVPVAQVVLKPSARPDGLTMALQQFLQRELAPYKVPRRYEIVDRLPAAGSRRPT